MLGRCVYVLSNEQMDKLIDLTLQPGSNSTGDTETVVFPSWLFALNSIMGSRETQDEAELVLSPELKQLNLHLASLDSLRLSSSTLQCLSISHVNRASFDLPSLRVIQLNDCLNPIDDTLPMQLNRLSSMSFHFDHSAPSVAVMESHLKMASKLEQLTTLEFSSPYNCPEFLKSIRIRQKDFPSVKKFIWAVPISFVFCPEDKFTELKVHTSSSFEFLNKEQGYEYKFDVSGLVHTSIELPQGGMAKLSHLQFSADS